MKRERAIFAGAAVLLFGVGFALGWLARGPARSSVASEDAATIGSAAPEIEGRSAAASGDGGAAAGTIARSASGEVEQARGTTPGGVSVVGASEGARNAAHASAPPSSFGPVPPPNDAGAPTGRLAASVIREEVRSHREELGFCFAWQLHQHPELRGRIMMDFTIGTDGRVVRAEVAEDEIGDATVARCFRGVTERMQFPAPEGGEVVVRYPFILSPDAPVPERRP